MSDQEFLRAYELAEAECIRLRAALDWCAYEWLRDAVRAELARAEDIVARMQSAAREEAKRRSRAA